MSTSTYYIATSDSDMALQIAWNERMAARPDNPSLALHADDIPARHREGQRIWRVQVGVRWEDGRPVLVNEAAAVEP